MRVRALARQIAVGAGIMVMLGGTGAGVAAAVPMATAESRAVDEATPTLPAEAGVTVPGGTNEGVGDVLGLGYEQVIRLNGSKLEIVDPMHRGGELRESFDVGARRKLPVPSMDPFALRYPGLADLYRITGPEFEARSEGHEASRLAVDGEHIYVSTIRGSNGAAADGAIVRKYKVERQGEARVLTEVNSRTVKGHFAITALDAFTFKDREYLAIGLNTTGVRVVRADVKVATDDDPEGGMPNYRTVNATWDGRKHGLHERDMVSAVALGTAGDDRLIVVAGRVTYEGSAIQATDLLVGEDDGNVWHHKDIWTNNHRGVEDAIFEHWEWTNLIEFGTVGPQKKPMVAISWPTRNRTSFLFPDSGITWNWTDGLAPTTAVRYFTDGEGNNRVFVRRAPAGPILGMSVNTDWEFYEDVPDGQVHFAVPGYQAWTVKLENRSRQAMAFRSYAGSSRTAGCWFGSDLKPTDRPLPKTVSTVAAGGVAGPFVTAQRTVGSNCTTEPGAMYATFAPSNAPEQAQTVKLLGDMEGMRVDQEVGAGVLTVRTEREGEFGIRLIIEDRNDAPTPVGGPTLTGTRLTPAPGSDYEPTDDVDDPTRPVFRFTVTDQRWHVPGADELTNVTLPVPTVEASTDQNTWTALGTTTSPLAPTRSETEPTELTLGDSTFYWQTTPGATDYRYFRLTLPDGTTSDTLDTTTLEAPQPTTKVDDIELIGGGAPRANGLDQAPMRVSVLDSLGQGIDPAVHADLYDRIYYRTATDALVTGLGNAQRPGRLFAVTQSGGQFSNTSIGMLASGSVPLYVSTNSLRSKEEFAAIIAPDSPEGDDGVEVVRSAAAAIGPQTKPLVGDGIAGSALSVANCVEGLCTLTEPTNTQPVLYRLSESTISLQLSTKGVHGALSLPLTDEQKGGAQRRLASSELVFNESSASTWLLQPEPFGPNATATASVVTHGELVTFESLYVSSR